MVPKFTAGSAWTNLTSGLPEAAGAGLDAAAAAAADAAGEEAAAAELARLAEAADELAAGCADPQPASSTATRMIELEWSLIVGRNDTQDKTSSEPGNNACPWTPPPRLLASWPACATTTCPLLPSKRPRRPSRIRLG